MNLCLHDLAEWTGGEVKFASMPPRAGDLTPIDQIVLKPAAIDPGDLFWCLAATRCETELAFLRGAIGVVCSDSAAVAWPGRFVVLVADPFAALQSLVDGFARQLALTAEKKFAQEASELKVLQLCAAQRADNSPPVQSRCRLTTSKCRAAA